MPENSAVPPLQPDLAPVFLVGTTRSGTSAVQLALLGSKRYQGHGEGHLSPLLQHLVAAVELFWSRSPDAIRQKAAVASVDKEAVLQGLYAVVREAYGKIYAGAVFAEKTPNIDAIRVAPLLQRVWPGVKVLHCRRRGIENVQSKRRKFPGQSFAGLCGEWRDCMLEWQRIRPLVPNYCEIDQLELALAPANSAARIGNFLGFSVTETQALARSFTEKFPERGGTSFAPVALENMPWTQEEKDTFRRICHPAMEAYGYSYDESYWSDPLPADSPETEGSDD